MPPGQAQAETDDPAAASATFEVAPGNSAAAPGRTDKPK
jgi:hypothetical protein